MADFQYSETGDRNLEVVGGDSRFTRWMYDEIKPYIRGHVLEAGSGVGTYSKYILKQDPHAVLSDVDAMYVRRLRKRYPRNDIFFLDISDLHHIAAIRKKHRFDTIIFLNVLEHVKDDRRALRLLRTLLKPNGRIICLVPTHKILFNGIDEAVGHHRRYTKAELRRKVIGAGYTVEKLFSFNVFAIPGWFINGRVLKRTEIDSSAMKLFNTCVPAFRIIERYVLFRSIGISTIVVAKKAKPLTGRRAARG